MGKRRRVYMKGLYHRDSRVLRPSRTKLQRMQSMVDRLARGDVIPAPMTPFVDDVCWERMKRNIRADADGFKKEYPRAFARALLTADDEYARRQDRIVQAIHPYDVLRTLRMRIPIGVTQDTNSCVYGRITGFDRLSSRNYAFVVTECGRYIVGLVQRTRVHRGHQYASYSSGDPRQLMVVKAPKVDRAAQNIRFSLSVQQLYTQACVVSALQARAGTFLESGVIVGCTMLIWGYLCSGCA